MFSKSVAQQAAFILVTTLVGANSALAMTIDVTVTQATVYGDASYPPVGSTSSTYTDGQPLLASGGASFTLPGGAQIVSASSVADVGAGHLGAYARSDVCIGTCNVYAWSEFYVSLELTDMQPGDFLTIMFSVHGSGRVPTVGSNDGVAFLDIGTDSRVVHCTESVCVGDTSPMYMNASNLLHAKLSVSAAPGGIMDFLNSADATIIAPAGAVIHDTTGLVHAVPIPATAWLFASALLGMAGKVRRRTA